MEIDKTARRVLGSLIEKQWTTPEQYPLTLNALLLACNQKSNRHPEMQIEEFILEGVLYQLRLDGLVTIVEREVGRTKRYAERMAEKLDLSRQDQAIVAELMLRGPQTSPELFTRCARMADFQNVEQVDGILQGMAAKHWTKLLPREARQRHPRWMHLFAPASEVEETPTAATAEIPVATELRPAASPPKAPWADDVASLRADIEALRAEVDELRGRLDRVGG